jgi:hypothetical protein
MASRGRRLVLGSLAAAAAVVVLLVATYWQPLRWRISAILTGNEPGDVLVLPDKGSDYRVDIAAGDVEVADLARFLTRRAYVNVLVRPEVSKPSITVAGDMTNVTTEDVLALLRENGWRMRRSDLAGGREAYTLERRKN